MNNKAKYLFKNLGILTISNFASRILVFLLVPLYTSVLSTEEYGIYDLVVSTSQLLFPLLTLNIVDAVMRFSMDQAKSPDDIGVIGLRYISLSVIPIAFFLLIESNVRLIPQIDNYLLYILLYYAFYILNQFCIQLAKGREKVFDMGVAGVAGTIVLIAGNVLFLLVYQQGLKGFFIANILAQAIPALYLGCRLWIWKYFGFGTTNKNLRKEMLKYCLPLIFTTISWWINNASDRYVVTFMIGAAANGVLSAAYKIPSILNTIQQIFVQAWQISAIKEYGREKTDEFYGSTFIAMNFMMCLCCSILCVSLEFIAPLMFKKEFFEAWKYIPFLLLSSVFNAASGFIGPILLAKKDSSSMARSAVFGSLCNIPLNIIFVYIIGIQGATIATVIASFIIYIIRRNAVGDGIKMKRNHVIYISWMILFIHTIITIELHSLAFQLLAFGLLLLINLSIIKEIIIRVRKHFSHA